MSNMLLDDLLEKSHMSNMLLVPNIVLHLLTITNLYAQRGIHRKLKKKVLISPSSDHN